MSDDDEKVLPFRPRNKTKYPTNDGEIDFEEPLTRRISEIVSETVQKLDRLENGCHYRDLIASDATSEFMLALHYHFHGAEHEMIEAHRAAIKFLEKRQADRVDETEID